MKDEIETKRVMKIVSTLFHRSSVSLLMDGPDNRTISMPCPVLKTLRPVKGLVEQKYLAETEEGIQTTRTLLALMRNNPDAVRSVLFPN